MTTALNAQIDRLFDSVESDLANEHFSIVNGLLQTIDVAIEPMEMLIAYLSITLAADDKLPARRMMRAMTSYRLEKERGQKIADVIMRGL